MTSFSSRIIRWQQRYGRHALPWQATRDPYRIWLSEVMLQQTQVATVIPYFERFLKRFPDLRALAAADEDTVLALWSGLGYYSRARNLRAAARLVVENHEGAFPAAAEAIAKLPGVGRSTAAAIAALAFGQHGAILDGNVKRVLARHGGIDGWPGNKNVEDALWRLADQYLPPADIEAYTQGMMDLGALACTRSRPSCSACPVNIDCAAFTQNRVAELPAPRPKKSLPEKQVVLLLLLNRGELMLEKRPSRGIWGGLWSLPELTSEADAAAHCMDRFGLTTIAQQTLPKFSHSFTHFRLHIQPVQLQLAGRGGERPGQIWLRPADALETGLPAPVRKLVIQLGTPLTGPS